MPVQGADFAPCADGEDLVIRIGGMLTYQDYDVKSPLNGLAAMWAAEHASLLPVDTREIAPPLRNGGGAEEIAAVTQAKQPKEGSARGDGWADRIVIDLGESGPSGRRALHDLRFQRWGRFGGIWRKSPDFRACGLPARENPHSPDRIWIRACWGGCVLGQFMAFGEPEYHDTRGLRSQLC